MKGLLCAILGIAVLGLLACPNEASANGGGLFNRQRLVQKQVVRQPHRQKVVVQQVVAPAYVQQQVVQQQVVQKVYAQPVVQQVRVQQVYAQPIVQRYVVPRQQVILQQQSGCAGNGGLQLNAGCQALYR